MRPETTPQGPAPRVPAPGAPDAGDRRRLLAAAAARLRAAGVDSADRDALWLLAAALGRDRPAALPREGPVDADAAARFEGFLARRALREPVSRILGRRGFWTLDLAVTDAVLDPRPDSETLVAGVLARTPDHGAALTIVDLGTGSGCLLLALLTELPAARGIGIDLSGPALQVAQANARTAGLADRAVFVQGDWAAALSNGCAELVVSNPPYIATAELPDLMPEVRDHDPRLALDGGPTGLDAYRRIVPALPRLLRPGGIAALEIDAATVGPTGALLRAAGATALDRLDDLGGRARVLVARW